MTSLEITLWLIALIGIIALVMAVLSFIVEWVFVKSIRYFMTKMEERGRRYEHKM